ncbi:glycoside hydrolase family 43 protein [Deinococcus pimensis]|uniref:glycoside hydrolase family 43 protein n=1 Tax=Deinococcus pimensis TaxID=309888 RepID=UPI0004B2ACF5|nr:glycoside hydrolase family 43 protein [Deinococcus pimensis]
MLQNGAPWLDTQGRPIQAHGGALLRHDDVTYWYGENKDGDTYQGFLHRVDVIGVSCYASTDLLAWRPEGVVLPARPDDPTHDLHPSNVAERPKVLRNPHTGKFVMWLHVDHADYTLARVGVAVADTPRGPFRYQGSFRPAHMDSRDFTVFQDDDGQAYLYFSSDWNATLRVVPLDDDYTGVRSAPTDVFTRAHREAPAVFRHGDRYFMLTSGCTGWDPNPAEYAVAPHPLGPWSVIGNPCQGPGADLTFGAQPTFALPLDDGSVLVMLDRWRKEDLRDSRYVWLRGHVHGEQLTLRWQDAWTGTHAQAAHVVTPSPSSRRSE